MDSKTLELLLTQVPALILGLTNAAFYFQLKRMSVEGELVKKKDEEIKTMKDEREGQRYQYQQLLMEYNKVEAENETYRKFNDHPLAERKDYDVS